MNLEGIYQAAERLSEVAMKTPLLKNKTYPKDLKQIFFKKGRPASGSFLQDQRGL